MLSRLASGRVVAPVRGYASSARCAAISQHHVGFDPRERKQVEVCGCELRRWRLRDG